MNNAKETEAAAIKLLLDKLWKVCPSQVRTFLGCVESITDFDFGADAGEKETKGFNCDPSVEQVPKGQSIIREAAKKAVDKFFQDNPDLVPGHIFEKGERWDNTSTTFQGGTEVTIGGVNKDSLIALRDHINEVLSQMS